MNEETLRFIHEHLDADVRSLALRRAPAGVDLFQALTQIEGHQLARNKLPTWAATPGLLWPARLSLEQCSSEATATYKRALVLRLLQSPAHSFADLTAGLGVDFAALAPLFGSATYVEQQASLCDLARHNMPLLGLSHATVRHTTAEAILSEPLPLFTLLLLDPARRDAAGRKVALLEECTPNVLALQRQLRAAAQVILLKLSPMLDITAAVHALAPVAEVHVVAVEGECKELLMVLDGDARKSGSNTKIPDEMGENRSEPCIHCVNLSSKEDVQAFAFTRTEEATATLLLAPALGKYLYEPNAALLKAGAYRLLCHRYPVRKLAPSTHLYTSDDFVADFPGRRWRILASTTFAKRELRAFLTDLPSADLTTRGFPLSTEQLRRQLHLRAGGGAHLVATTLADGTRVLCKVS